MVFLKSQRGLAMPIIIMMIAIVFLFATTVLTLNDNLTKNVDLTVKRENALQIAEAGYNRYLYYLNQDSTFHKSKEGKSIEGSSPSEELGFKPIEFDDNGLPVKYEITTYKNGETVIGNYQIRVIQPLVNQDLTVISTGWTAENPAIKRSVQVKLHKRSFAEYVDFTASSGDVRWITGNVADGPVFCNSDILVDGNPKFLDDVITAGRIRRLSGNPIYEGRVLEYQPKMTFPVINEQIEIWGKSTKGLYFTGRTCILIDNNKLKVRCKDNGDVLEEYAIPESGVVYVEGGNVFISGILDGRMTVYAKENIYITAKDCTNFNPSRASKITANGETGLLYKDNRVPNKNDTGSNFSDDLLGLISEKNIIIATKTWPASTGQSSNNSYSDVAVSNLTIYGALMTFKQGRQIYVENYDNVPDMGYLSVVGSKIQNGERGAVGTYGGWSGETGYSKQDRFDYRLKTEAPPHFIEPSDSGWEVRSWEEIPNPE